MLDKDELIDALTPGYDVEEISNGIELVLEYLNDSNEFEKLELIQRRARIWCLEYFGPSKELKQSIDTVLAEHPRLFDLNIPSLLRLDPGLMIQPDVEIEEPESETCPFPAWSEPMLLSDAYLYRILDLYDEEHQDDEPAHTDSTTTGGCFDYKMNARNLAGSPILFFLPAVLAHITRLDLSELEDLEDSSEGSFTRTNSTNSTTPDRHGAQTSTGFVALASRALDKAFPGRSRSESEKKPGLSWPTMTSIGKLAQELPKAWKKSGEGSNKDDNEDDAGDDDEMDFEMEMDQE